MSTSPAPPGGHEDDGARLAAHERRLRLLLAHLSGRAVRARIELDDLVQEVWLRAIGLPGGLPPSEPGDARLWRLLRVLARRAVVDAARAIRAGKRSGSVVRLARSEWSTLGPRASGIVARGPGPATRAGELEEQGRLLAAFDRLSPEHRRVIGLRQMEGLSARETARRTGRSEAAVHSLYRRALAAWSEEVSRSSRDEFPPGSRPGSS